MTLDEIEKGALSMVDYFNDSREVTCNVNAAVNLARAVLAMLPVVRAAIAADDDETRDEQPRDGYARRYHRMVLNSALLAMRAVLEPKS